MKILTLIAIMSGLPVACSKAPERFAVSSLSPASGDEEDQSKDAAPFEKTAVSADDRMKGGIAGSKPECDGLDQGCLALHFKEAPKCEVGREAEQNGLRPLTFE
ncbi:MAG: hypothetical protein EOP09_17850, partial [Proteobacteria bacterium]